MPARFALRASPGVLVALQGAKSPRVLAMFPYSMPGELPMSDESLISAISTSDVNAVQAADAATDSPTDDDDATGELPKPSPAPDQHASEESPVPEATPAPADVDSGETDEADEDDPADDQLEADEPDEDDLEDEEDDAA